MIHVTSEWKIEKDEQTKNLTGTITLLSPFDGLKRGLLASKIYTNNNREIRGVADLDLDHKKFTASIKGNLEI